VLTDGFLYLGKGDLLRSVPALAQQQVAFCIEREI